MRAVLFRLGLAGAVFAALAYSLGGCAVLHNKPLDRVAVTCDDKAKPDCAPERKVIVK